jgi:hypothetical protein
VRGNLDDDVDEPPAVPGELTGQPPQQPHPGTPVQRRLVGQPGDDPGELIAY